MNRLAERARGDAIAVADTEVAEAQAAARAAGAAMAQFRNSSGLLDPEKEADDPTADDFQAAGQLIPRAPSLCNCAPIPREPRRSRFCATQRGSLEARLRSQTAGIAGGNGSLSANAARYQELRLESELAAGSLRPPRLARGGRMPKPGASAPMSNGLPGPSLPTMRPSRGGCAVSLPLSCSACCLGRASPR